MSQELERSQDDNRTDGHKRSNQASVSARTKHPETDIQVSSKRAISSDETATSKKKKKLVITQ